MSNIRKLFDKAYAAARERSYTRGILGDADGNLLSTTRPDFVRVRVSQEGRQSVTLARHLGRVPLRVGLPVRMTFENSVFVIEGVDSFYFSEATAGDTTNSFGVTAHNHNLASGLTYVIEAMRLEPGLVRPAGGWTVTIESARYYASGSWQTFLGETSLSLLGNRPSTTGKHRLVIITIDPSTNTTSVVNGSDEDYATALTQADIDAVSIGDKIPLAAVLMRADDTTINIQARFIDARGWLNLGGAGAAALTDLTDTNIASPTNGQLLYYNSVGGWFNGDPPGIPQGFEDLEDVSFTTLGDGDVVVYDSGISEWVNTEPTLDWLNDVTITTPADGDVLTYDNGTFSWVNAAPSGGGGGGALDDLTDVVAPTPATDDVLQFDGTNWVNVHIARTLITDWSFRDAQSLSTSSFAWKGNRFTPDVDVDIYALCYFGTIVANGVYQAAVITGTATPGNVATATKTATYTAGSSPATLLGGHMWLEFATPVTLTAGTQYGLMVGRTDGAGTYQLPVNFNGGTNAGNAVPMVGLSHGTGWRVADAALTIGTAISEAGGNSMACGFRFRYPSSNY